MKNLTEGKLGRSLLLFSIPAILTAYLSQAYSLADTVIIGRFLGERCFAASASTSSLSAFLSSLFWGYGTGASAYTARLFSEKNYTKLRRVVHINVFVCFVFSTLIGILAVLLRNPIFDLLNVEEEIRRDAAIYFAVIMLGAGMRDTGTMFSFMTASMGDSSFGFYLSLLSAVINVGGNLLSVTVLHWGIFGVAFFSILSVFIGLICYTLKYKKFFASTIPEKQEKEPFDFADVRTVFSYSVACILQQASLFAVGLLIAPAVNKLGTSALAARSIIGSISVYVSLCHLHSARAVATHNAQCLGLCESAKQKLSRMRRALFTGILQSQMLGMVITIPILLFPNAITSIFLSGSESAESLRLASMLLCVNTLTYILYCFSTVMHSFLRAVKAMWILYASTMFSSVANLVLSVLLISPLGLLGVYLAQGLAWAAEIVLLFFIYISKVWIPQELRAPAVQKSAEPVPAEG